MFLTGNLLSWQIKSCQCFEASDVGNTTTRNNTFFNCCAGSIKSILNPSFLLFHFDFSCCTDIDDGNTTDQFGKSLLKFFTIVIRGSIFNLVTNLLYASSKFFFLTSTINDGGIIFINNDTFTGTEIIDCYVLKLDSQIFSNNLTTGEDSDVFQHCLTTITKTRSLNSSYIQGTAKFIDHQGSKSFTVNIFSNNAQTFTHFGNRLEYRQQIFHAGYFLLHQEDVRIFHAYFHTVRIGYKVGGEVTTIELHTFNDIKSGVH